ncbi:mechanosensitive ion channel [Lysobacter sp. CW239]|uniref:mechanosensitive ion channel domain-containing protein n=1 Tax=Lysobacteraceae TaxID=32033 RepID=UPI00068E12D8|nr:MULTISPECIES: mechanosensitive ion channel domain-containing protein [Lysobacter]QOD92189.1 mechanosensitive ion channel [Lysobacter sp. CW239]
MSRDLARRLHGVAGLEDVVVTVQAGVARLDGTVIEVEDRVQAAQIASQQPGVDTVENHVQVSTRLSDRLDAAVTLVIEKLLHLVAAIPLLAVAIALVMLSWWLGRGIGRRIARRKWRSKNPYLDGLVQNLVQWLVLLVGVLVALDLLGATALVGAVLGSAGVIGLAMGFAFKDIAENYVAGILLSLRRPFEPGDSLRIDSYDGKVVALTSRATILMTFDGNRLSLPNALVFKSVVLNFSRNPKRRFDFAIPVDPATSIGRAQEVAMNRIAATDGVLPDPGPSWIISGYEGDGLKLQFFGWIDQRQNDLGKVRSAAIRAVKKAFFDAGIESPRSVRYLVSVPAAEAATAGTTTTDAAVDIASQDISINRDIDQQLADAQRAHSTDDLLPPSP